MTMPTHRDEISRAIAEWEGLYSSHPNDKGNWIGPRLVGTMRGVTGETLAAHRGISPEQMTAEIVKSVTLKEATDIGERFFYHGVLGIDTLPWGPTTAVLLDWAWGSFAYAIKGMQRHIGAKPDGVIGPATREAYVRWIAAKGWETATRELVEARRRYYIAISEPGTANEVFRAGWLRRCAWQSPANAAWWSTWAADMPPVPQPYTTPGKPKPAAVPAPVKPASQSRTLKAVAGVAASGAVTLTDKATDGAVTEIATTAATKIAGYAGLGGAIMWILVAVTVAGSAYAIWRIVQDRRAPA